MSENTPSRSSVSLLTIGVLLVALTGAFLIGLRIQSDPDPSAQGVVTQGKGSATATPDQLKFSVTVSNRAASTKEAMDRTGKGVKAVVAALKKLGVEDKDIQTTNISVEPHYNYARNEEKIDGYVSSSSLRVTIRDLDEAGKAISAAATAAGNTATVQEVSMSLSNKNDLIAEAREKAVKSSKKSAQALARAAGRDVDELVYVEEIDTDSSEPSFPADGMYDAGSAVTTSDAAAPVQAGEQKVTVRVKVRWSLG